MNKKGKCIVVLFVFISAFFIVFDWLRFDLSEKIDKIGFDLILGMFIVFLLFLFWVLAVIAIIIFVKNLKSNKMMAIIPITSILIVVAYFSFINYSPTYIKIDHKINVAKRTEIIREYESGKLEQININRYLVPYRFCSHNKKVYIQKKNGVIKAIFYVSNGVQKSRVVFYVSDERFANINDFGEYPNHWIMRNIKKIEANWYYADL